MKTKEDFNSLKEEVITLNRKPAEKNEEELKQVTGGSDSREMNSKDVYNVMFTFINQKDESSAVIVYRSKGFLLEVSDRESIRFIFKQFFGYEIEESPYNQ